MSETSDAARALGKKRWAGVKKADRAEAMQSLAAKRSESLTPERRREIAAKASAAATVARKKKAKAKKSQKRKVSAQKDLAES